MLWQQVPWWNETAVLCFWYTRLGRLCKHIWDIVLHSCLKLRLLGIIVASSIVEKMLQMGLARLLPSHLSVAISAPASTWCIPLGRHPAWKANGTKGTKAKFLTILSNIKFQNTWPVWLFASSIPNHPTTLVWAFELWYWFLSKGRLMWLLYVMLHFGLENPRFSLD